MGTGSEGAGAKVALTTAQIMSTSARDAIKRLDPLSCPSFEDSWAAWMDSSPRIDMDVASKIGGVRAPHILTMSAQEMNELHVLAADNRRVRSPSKKGRWVLSFFGFARLARGNTSVPILASFAQSGTSPIHLRHAEGQHLAARLVGSRPLRTARNVKILSQRRGSEAMPSARHGSEPNPAVVAQVEAFVLIIRPLVVLAAQKDNHAVEQRAGPAAARRGKGRGGGPLVGGRIVDVVQAGHVLIRAKASADHVDLSIHHHGGHVVAALRQGRRYLPSAGRGVIDFVRADHIVLVLAATQRMNLSGDRRDRDRAARTGERRQLTPRIRSRIVFEGTIVDAAMI